MKQKKAKPKKINASIQKTGLYRIKCEFDEVIYLGEDDLEYTNDRDLLDLLLREQQQSFYGSPKFFSIKKIKNEKDIPKEWNLACIPYNAPEEKMTAEFLAEEIE